MPRVLIVNNDRVVAQALAAQLKEVGFESVTCKNACDAALASTKEPFSAVVSGINYRLDAQVGALPKDYVGCEALLDSVYGKLPVVLVADDKNQRSKLLSIKRDMPKIAIVFNVKNREEFMAAFREALNGAPMETAQASAPRDPSGNTQKMDVEDMLSTMGRTRQPEGKKEEVCYALDGRQVETPSSKSVPTMADLFKPVEGSRVAGGQTQRIDLTTIRMIQEGAREPQKPTAGGGSSCGFKPQP